MGYEIERFTSPVNEGLLCSVCRDVLQDPLQAPCEHVFCGTCIAGWLTQERSCPEDRRPLSVGDLKPVFRYMKNDLDRLQLKCDNAAAGCQAVCTLDALRTHRDECEYEKVSCSVTGCSARVLRRDLQQHVMLCTAHVRGNTSSQAQAAEATQPRTASATVATCNCNCSEELHEVKEELRDLKTVFQQKLEEQRRDHALRLDAQRRHMVAREASVRAEVATLRGQLGRVAQEVTSVVTAERQREEDLVRMVREREKLVDTVASLQKQVRQQEGVAFPGSTPSPHVPATRRLPSRSSSFREKTVKHIF